MMLDEFRGLGVSHPELCFLTSTAVGFPVAIYEKGALVYGVRSQDGRAERPAYQVMRWHDRPGPGCAFWRHDQFTRPQFYGTPEDAAAAFVVAWQEWQRRGGSTS